jgi:hypothetical protein
LRIAHTWATRENPAPSAANQIAPFPKTNACHIIINNYWMRLSSINNSSCSTCDHLFCYGFTKNSLVHVFLVYPKLHACTKLMTCAKDEHWHLKVKVAFQLRVFTCVRTQN